MSHSHRAKALPGRSARTCPNRYRRGGAVRAPDSTDINVSIRNPIQDEVDCVIICLGREALKSEWVRSECECVHEREKSRSNNA